MPGLFLAEIDRDGKSMPAVSPREVLQAGDRLLFVGVVESVVELQKIRGLVPATEDVFHLKAPRPQRCLIEAVVSNTSPLLGKTIRDARFRSHYNAVVVAVARNGQRLHEKIGDIILHAGDVVLVEAHPSFADQHRNSRDFYLVSTIEGSSPPRHNLALVAVGSGRWRWSFAHDDGVGCPVCCCGRRHARGRPDARPAAAFRSRRPARRSTGKRC